MITGISYQTRWGIQYIMGRAFREKFPPAKAARLMRSSIGLNARQARALENAYTRLSKASGKTILLGKTKVKVPVGGLSPELLDRRLSQYSTRMRNYRTKMIARTETIASSNEGQRQLWLQAQQQGLLTNEVRQWIFTGGERGCPICEGLSGTTAPLNGTFPGGYEGPPAHPNCRCSVGLAVRKAKQKTPKPQTPTQVGKQPITKPVPKQSLPPLPDPPPPPLPPLPQPPLPPIPKYIGEAPVVTPAPVAEFVPITPKPKVWPVPKGTKKISQKTIDSIEAGLKEFDIAHPKIAASIRDNRITIKKKPGDEYFGSERHLLGLHKPTGQIYIYEYTPIGTKIREYVGTALHELGHSYHTQHGIPRGLRNVFKSEYSKLTKGDQYLASHYNLNSHEAFAETFAHIYGNAKGSGNLGRAKFEKKFKETIKMVKEFVEGVS